MSYALGPPFPSVPLPTLLAWAHRSPPPFDAIRPLAGWLTDDEQIRAYLDGVIEGWLRVWLHGPLFQEQSR